MFDLVTRQVEWQADQASDGSSAALTAVTCSLTNNHRDVIFILKCLIIVYVGLHVDGGKHAKRCAGGYGCRVVCLFSLLFALVACLKILACVFSSLLTLTEDVMSGHFLSFFFFNVECHSIFQMNIVIKGFVADGAVCVCHELQNIPKQAVLIFSSVFDSREQTNK